jgi:probable HAF family extracellular repeat protein
VKRALTLIAAFLLLPLLVRLLLAQGLPSPPAPPPPPTYTLTDLGPMQITAAPSGATALNNSAQVTGFYYDSTFGANRAFLWNNGTSTEFGTLGGAASFGYGINGAGQVVGTSDASSSGGNSQSAFIWLNGKFTSNLNAGVYSVAYGINSAGDVVGYQVGTDSYIRPIIWKGGTPAGAIVLTPLPCPYPVCQGEALAVNDLGQAAGWSIVPGGTYHPVMWDSTGQPTDIGTLGGASYNNQANAINNSGVVVGYSQLDAQTVHAFVWQQGGAPQDLGVIPGLDPNYANLADNNSSAWGINSNGDIVGVSGYGTGIVTQGNGGRAFLYSSGTMYDLTSLLVPGTNWKLEAAWAINDNGQIVGVGIGPDQTEHGFLLTPLLASTTTSLSASVNPSVYGQQVILTVNVNPTSPSSLTPSGTVTINDGSTTLGTVRLGSSDTFNTSILTAGTHIISASYSGDNNFSPSSSAVLNQIVNQAGTTTTLVSVSPNPAILGQPVSFTANVSVVAPGSATSTEPSGTITFSDGTTKWAATLSGGSAIATISSLTLGSHSVTASYGADANLVASVSAATILSVTPAAPAITSPTSGSSTVNSSVTVTGTGTSGAEVDIQEGATKVGTTTVNSDGSYSATITLAVGVHSLTATQTVNGVTSPATAAVSITVLPAAPAITSPATAFSTTDQIVTVSGTAMPSASVNILDGGTTVGTITADAKGNFLASITFAVGTHALTATQTFNGVTSAASAAVSLTILLAPTVITDNETITVTDTASFPDVFDPEAIRVADAVWITPLIQVAAPVASFSVGSLGFGSVAAGQTSTQPLTLSNIGGAPLVVSSAVLSQGSAFAISQISCSNGATSLPTTMPIGGACVLTISYLAPPGTAANDTLTFTDDAALSNVASLPAGSSFVQAIPLNGMGSSAPPPPPPPAVIPITDNEAITVTDALSFSDISDSEQITVTDQVAIQVLNTTTTLISAPGVVYGMPAAVTVSVSSAYGTVSGNVTLSVDGGAPTTMALSSGSVVFSAGVLPPGTHSLAASFPAQGNFLASSATGAVFVSQPPAFTSANATTFTVGAAGTFSVTTTGVPFPSLTIPPGTLPTGVTFTDNTNGTATLTGTPQPGATGVFPLTITASNGVSVPAVQSFTLTVNQPPSITSGNTTTFTEGAPGSFTVTTAGFPIPAISESPALPAGLILVDNGDGTASLSGTPATGTQGSYAITIAATNGVSPGASQSFTLNINLGPAITSGSSTTFTEQMPGSFLVTTQGFPAPVLKETGALPSGVTFTDNHDGTATLAGTPSVGTSNSYPITISASNGVGAPTIQAFTLTVNATASISSGSTTTFTVGSAGFFSITTMGTPAPALTFTGTLPTGVMFTDNGNGTATLSGTPAPGTANSYPLAITASNGVGTPAMQNFTLVVNQGAAILTGNSTTFTVGVPGTFTVMTSGSPTPTLTETPPLLPTGVTFVDNGDGTATLSGTPAAGTGGTYPLTITANNGVDLPAVQTFTLNINQNPAIISSNVVTFNELVMGSFVVTATGNPIPALTEIGNLPNGVTFTDNGDGTAFLGGIPAAGSAGQYGFTITAANGVLPSATQTFTLTVVPGLSFTSPNSTTFNVGSQNSFTITVAGTPTPTLTHSGTLPAWLTFTQNSNGTATLSGDPPGGTEGSYAFTVTATNRTGAIATQVFTLNVVLPSSETAPVITSANQATFVAGLIAGNGISDPYNFFKVTTTGFPVPKLTAKFVLGGSGSVSYFHDNGDGTATIAFTPGPQNPGTTVASRFTITAAGPSGLTATQLFTLQTVGLGPAPKFTSANQVGFTAGVPSSFTVAAGPFVDTITMTDTAGNPIPAIDGLFFTDNHNGTATLSGTPNLGTSGQTVSAKITFTASNTNLAPSRKTPYTATQTFTLVILPSGDSAPVITSANQATFVAGLTVGDGISDPYNFFKVTTTGFPVPKLTAKFVLGGSGSVSYFHDNGDGTATIAFTPGPQNPGTTVASRFTITAAGPSGLTATQLFTLQTVGLGPAPKFTSANQVGFTAGVPSSFTVAAGPFVDTITMTDTAGNPIPAIDGLFFTDNHNGTATLSGTPNLGTSGQTVSAKITFTASNTNLAPSRKTPYTATQTFTLVILP